MDTFFLRTPLSPTSPPPPSVLKSLAQLPYRAITSSAVGVHIGQAGFELNRTTSHSVVKRLHLCRLLLRRQSFNIMASTILMHSIPASPRTAINISSRKSIVRGLFPANHSPRLAPRGGVRVRCMTEERKPDLNPSLKSKSKSKGQDLFIQISEGGIPWFIGTSILLLVASLVPLFQGVTAESKSDGVDDFQCRVVERKICNVGTSCVGLHRIC
ncbi:hypothetical protein NL676_029516 [Syzygium grande]|nr:hypothetical protein NL676_029516 [Syzygium grande]